MFTVTYHSGILRASIYNLLIKRGVINCKFSGQGNTAAVGFHQYDRNINDLK